MVGFASANTSKCCWQVGYTEVAILCWVSVPVCVTVMFVHVGLDGVTRLGETLGSYLELEGVCKRKSGKTQMQVFLNWSGLSHRNVRIKVGNEGYFSGGWNIFKYHMLLCICLDLGKYNSSTDAASVHWAHWPFSNLPVCQVLYPSGPWGIPGCWKQTQVKVKKNQCSLFQRTTKTWVSQGDVIPYYPPCHVQPEFHWKSILSAMLDGAASDCIFPKSFDSFFFTQALKKPNKVGGWPVAADGLHCMPGSGRKQLHKKNAAEITIAWSEGKLSSLLASGNGAAQPLGISCFSYYYLKLK